MQVQNMGQMGDQGQIDPNKALGQPLLKMNGELQDQISDIITQLCEADGMITQGEDGEGRPIPQVDFLGEVIYEHQTLMKRDRIENKEVE